MNNIVPNELIESKIYVIRGQKVMMDKSLAELYQVETRVLNQAVKRNIERFPDDFMFQLNDEEFKNWLSQFVMSNSKKMGMRRLPYAFTEQGVAMLSSVLNSKRAIQINIQIIRTFTKLREFMKSHKELFEMIKGIEKRYDSNFKIVFEIIDQLLIKPDKTNKRIGFISD